MTETYKSFLLKFLRVFHGGISARTTSDLCHLFHLYCPRRCTQHEFFAVCIDCVHSGGGSQPLPCIPGKCLLKTLSIIKSTLLYMKGVTARSREKNDFRACLYIRANVWCIYSAFAVYVFLGHYAKKS